MGYFSLTPLTISSGTNTTADRSVQRGVDSVDDNLDLVDSTNYGVHLYCALVQTDAIQTDR